MAVRLIERGRGNNLFTNYTVQETSHTSQIKYPQFHDIKFSHLLFKVFSQDKPVHVVVTCKPPWSSMCQLSAQHATAPTMEPCYYHTPTSSDISKNILCLMTVQCTK